MVGGNGEAFLAPLGLQQAYLDLTEEQLQQRRQEQFYYHPFQMDPLQDPLQMEQQQPYQLDAVRQAVEEAMPGVYAEIDRIRSSENEADRKKALHHARGTSLFQQNKEVLEIDLASPGFRAFRAPHHGLQGNEDSAAAEARYGKTISDGKLMKKRRVWETGDGKKEVDKTRYQVRAEERTDKKGKKEYDHKETRKNAMELGQRYLRTFFEAWDSGEEKTEIRILLRGYDHGGVVAAEVAMMLRYWISDRTPEYLDYVKFELVQNEPVEQTGMAGETPLDLYSDNDEEVFERDGERMMPLGKSAETTVIYSLTGGAMPQSIRGAKRMILTAGNTDQVDTTQRDGAHQAVMTDSKTGEVYRGSGINDLPEGVYLMDASRTLVRVQSYEQAALILSRLLQSGEEEKRRRVLLDAVKSWFGVQADMTEEESDADAARGDLIADVKQIPFSGGKDSKEMTEVKTAMLALRPLLDKTIGDGGGLAALQGAYAALIDKCSYYESKKNPWTASGKRRLQMVKTIRLQTEQEQQRLAQIDVTAMAALTWRLALHTLGAQPSAPQDGAGQPKTAARKKHTGRVGRKAFAALYNADIIGDSERRQMREHVEMRRNLRSRSDQVEKAKQAGCENELNSILDLIETYYTDSVMYGNIRQERYKARREIREKIEAFKQQFGENKEAMELLAPYLPAFALPEQGKLKVDLDHVPAEQKRVGTDDELMPKMEWKEFKNVTWADRSKAPLFEREPSVHDVQQGKLGDCYFLSALASVVKTNPDKIREMVRDNGDGTVTVRFFKKEEAAQEGDPPTGTPFYVTVQKTVLCTVEEGGKAGQDVLAKNYLWVQLLEKAWAVSGLHIPGEEKYDKKKDAFRNDTMKVYQACKEQVKKENPTISGEELTKEAKARYSRTYMGATGGHAEDALFAITGQNFQRKRLMRDSKGVYDPKGITGSVRTAIQESGLTDEEKEIRFAAVSHLRKKLEKAQKEERKRRKVKTMQFEKPMSIERLTELWEELIDEDIMGVIESAEARLMARGFALGYELKEKLRDAILGMKDTLIAAFEKKGYLYHEAFSTKTDDATGETVGNYTEAAMNTYNEIKTALDAGQPVCAATAKYDEGGETLEEKLKDGLAGGHGYSVIGCQERDGFCYVMVHNPWGRYTRGYEKLVDENGREQLKTYAHGWEAHDRNGISLLELNDFLSHFNGLSCRTA